jgi:hypothetical protein
MAGFPGSYRSVRATYEFGTKRTSKRCRPMSVFGGRAERSGHPQKSRITTAILDRFAGKYEGRYRDRFTKYSDYGVISICWRRLYPPHSMCQRSEPRVPADKWRARGYGVQKMIDAARRRASALTAHSWNLFGTFLEAAELMAGSRSGKCLSFQ